MSRTASLERSEAESLLGPRGNLAVNVDNRALVRKWLVSCGATSAFVGTQTLATLQTCYNDTTDAALETALRLDSTNKIAPNIPNAPAQTASVMLPTTPADDVAALAVLRQLLGSTSAPINEDRVREIMRQELPSLIPVTRLEIIKDGVTKDHGAGMRHKQLPTLLRLAAKATPAVALIGPAGAGKTTACEQVAKVLGLEFYLQGACSGTHELIGYCDATRQYQTTPFREAFEHGGLICCDELDSWDAGASLILNAGLANGHMAFPDQPKPVLRHKDFRCVANLNTYGNGADRIYVGRNALDGAFKDRFAMLDWRYDETLERALTGNDKWCDHVQALRRGAEHEKARIIISPRASIYGAADLAAGGSWGEVEELFIWRGCDVDLRKRIESAAKQ
jgi:cobaltochelatase CobS